MRKAAFFLVTLSALAAAGCHAEPAAEGPAQPEIPSRAEVAEAARLGRPASAARLATLSAYHARVCAARPAAKVEEGPRKRRGCIMGLNPLDEISALEKLRKESGGSADEPKILERMILVWGEVGEMAARDCEMVRPRPSMTVREAEDAERELYAVENALEKAISETARLCEEVHARYPGYALRARCPGVNAPAREGEGWFIGP